MRNVHLQITAEKIKQVAHCTLELVETVVAIFSCNVKNVTDHVKFSEIQQNHHLDPC